METRKYRKQNHPAISKQHIGLDTQKIGTRRNKVQKKASAFWKQSLDKKKTTEHEKGNQFQKQKKKIKLVEFYLQIKPPQNQKKTQVVKCRQENHNSNRRRREKKGKEAGAAAATATIQGNNVP